MTPLKAIRLSRNVTLYELADAVDSHPGNLSRIENAKQGASPQLAERLARHFGHAVTEMQILYPERYIPSQVS